MAGSRWHSIGGGLRDACGWAAAIVFFGAHADRTVSAVRDPAGAGDRAAGADGRAPPLERRDPNDRGGALTRFDAVSDRIFHDHGRMFCGWRTSGVSWRSRFTRSISTSRATVIA